MEDQLKQKLRRKKLRAIGVAAVVVAVAAVILFSLNIERADYTSVLRKEISQANDLLAQSTTQQGNAKGQYAAYTLLDFQNNIQAAQSVLDNSQSQYTDKQTAYETLKQQVADFEKAANDNVISQQQMEQLQAGDTTGSYTADWVDGQTISVTIQPQDITQPQDINLMIRQQGPYQSVLSGTYQQAQLNGQEFTLYHDGDFGASLTLSLPVSDADGRVGDLYWYNRDSSRLELLGDSVTVQDGVAQLTLTKGGDYFFALRNSSAVVQATAQPQQSSQPQSQSQSTTEQTALPTSVPTAQPQTGGDTQAVQPTAAPPVENGSGSSATTPTAAPTSVPVTTAPPTNNGGTAQKSITVSLEIRCDPLAQDPTRLTDEAKRAYVPSDGTILATTTYQVNEGSTVFDVLNSVCRNNNIQVEYSYYSGFQSYYIEGINHLYEFDGGQLSGWLYRVNGVFPNYGCSAYTLKDGDSIAFLYTCNGGADVGNPWPQQ